MKLRIQARDSQIDATRIKDEKLVYIKCILSEGDELRIALMFSQEPHRDDRHNHAVPILDHFEDPQDAGFTYIVMPLLHDLDEPPFQCISDITDFVTQMLEVCVMFSWSRQCGMLTRHSGRASLTCTQWESHTGLSLQSYQCPCSLIL